MAVKLDYFDYDLVEQYFLRNLLENDFWLFAAYSDDEQISSSRNTERDSRKFLENTVFGLKYSATDISFMVPLQLWRTNTVFTQYDDGSVLKDTPFFVVIEPESETGNYHIFKCISNNNGSISVEPPIFNPTIQDGLYFLSDGYVWKYMSSTPSDVFRKFFSRGLLPIIRNQQVEDIASEGIYNTVVENRLQNSGYQRIVGDVNSVDIQNGITIVFLKNLFSETAQTIPIFDIPNIYSGQALYIEKSESGSGIGGIELTISESGVIGNQPFVSVATPSNFIIDINDKIEVLPKVLFQGNGNNASGIAIFDSENERIDSIRMINFGDNYTSAKAVIVDPFGFDPSNPNRQDVRCNIRPIISPKGGHGANILSELKTRRLGLSKTITSASPSLVPDSGFYGKIAVVKNPVFDSNTFSESTFDNRIKVELEFLPGNMQPGDQVEQGNVIAKVHEVDASANTIFVVEYDGPYDDVLTDSEPLRYENGNFEINSIEYSPYVSRSGEVVMITDVTPIERDENRSEQIKIVIDF